MAKKNNPKNGGGAIAPAPTDTAVTVQVVLDRSGSMSSIRGATIEGFNAFLAEQRALAGARFGLTQFDHDGGKPCIDVVYADVPVESVAPLTEATYRPRGGTPLYDAIGVTIAALEGRNLSGRVVFVIITDGEENQSREWNDKTVLAKIAEKRAAGWEFVYIGANVDAYVASAALGIPAQSTLQYDSTDLSTKRAFAGVSRATTSYRSGHTAAMRIDQAMAEEPAEPASTTKRTWQSPR